MTNIYLTDSDEDAIVDVFKDHEELYTKYTSSRTTSGRIARGKNVQVAKTSQ